ncbi:MAG: Type 1 glutamine amidotransferase-like domain-containing protein [Clostridia bacterium]|nr:Type 1 glutamine amidotransferase-like domain-containing protein [Clostridia bacterium]
MKLILSSCDFRNEKSQKLIMDNLPYSINKCRLLFIPNEKATEEAVSGDVYYDRMQEFGFVKENVYVFDHKCPNKFRNLDIDVIYISGGNTFGTLDKIRKCGFDKDIIDYVKSGVVYIGGSAGAHIASKNIKHVENYDENIVGSTDYSGLGLFDGILICHYTEARKYDFEQLSQHSEFKAYALTDEDSIVYEEE